MDVNHPLDPKTWPELNFFALVQAEGDILPVRTVYGDGRIASETNIGLNPLTSKKPIWFAGPDIVGSALLTGKAPKILRAIRFEGVGSQKEMKSVQLGKGSLNPSRDRRLNRDQARPYNFALSPVIVNLSGTPVTLIGPFEKNPARWRAMAYINIHDGNTHTLKPPTIPVIAQTFETVFSQYVRHPEYKSVAPDGTACQANSHGLLRRYPVTASEFRLIGKETERGWEQAEDISTLLPSFKRYERNIGTATESLREGLHKMSLHALQNETGLSRHTILRARRGKGVHPRSLKLLRIAVRT